ncbi:MAG: hypothetical protein ABI237_09215 [Ginsengibacter sp.]
MKTELQYVNDIKVNIRAVQVSLAEWKKMLNKIKKYEQALKLKSHMEEAFKQTDIIKEEKDHKQTLNEFLNELHIIISDKFKKEAKRLTKEFPSLKQELSELNDFLSKFSESGIPLGNNTYKIGISIKSKGKGKSGGARVITYLFIQNQKVYLLIIYDKSEFDMIDDKVIKHIIETLHSNK